MLGSKYPRQFDVHVRLGYKLYSKLEWPYEIIYLERKMQASHFFSKEELNLNHLYTA